MGRLLIRGMTPAEHLATPHTNAMMASDFLSDTKGNVGLGLNKLLTANLALRELASDRLIIEDTASTTTRDLVLATLRSRDIKFENPYANVDTQGGSDSYIAFRYWDGKDWVTAAQLLTPRGFLILNGTLCPFRSYSASDNIDYVDFTNLDINTHKCYLLLASLVNPTNSGLRYVVFVEGDYTATNYYAQYCLATATGVSAARENNSALGGVFAGERCSIAAFFWVDPGGYFRWFSVNCRQTGSSVSAETRAGSKTAAVTNVTSIRIASDVAGGIGAGSRLMLFRLGG